MEREREGGERVSEGEKEMEERDGELGLGLIYM